MSERFEPGKTPQLKIGERGYTTLRGLVVKSAALIALGGAIISVYGINRVRIEENSANQEKTRITREFYQANPNPNPGQLFELKTEVDDVNKFSKSLIITTTAGATAMSLGIFATGLAYSTMAEESRPTDKKKRGNQPLTGTL